MQQPAPDTNARGAADSREPSPGGANTAPGAYQMLELVLNHFPGVVFWKDSDLVYLGCNRAFATSAGLSEPAGIVGKTDFDLPWAKTEAAHYRADDREVLTSGRSKLGIIETQLQADGHVRWFETSKVLLHDSDGKVIGVLGTAHDITEKVATTQRLTESETRYRNLFEQCPLPLWEEDLSGLKRHLDSLRASGVTDLTAQFEEHPEAIDECVSMVRCIDVNSATLRLFGARARQDLPKSLAHACLKDAPESLPNLLLAMWEGRTSLRADVTLHRLDGSNVDLAIQAMVQEGCSADYSRVTVATVDITDRLRAQLQLRRARDEAEAANRAKDVLLAAVSHELRTPLTPALLLTTSLENNPSLPASARRDLASVRENIEIETRLIADLLDFTAARTGRLSIIPTPTSLHATLRSAVRTCQAELNRKQIRLTCDLNASPCLLNGDPDRLCQVFWNLLINAIKFTPDAGQITISTRNIGADEANPLHTPRLCVEVSDSGVGIDPNSLRTLFKPFGQVSATKDSHRGGLGLGLAISKAIAEAHGGSITAFSKGLGQGTTFTVILPAHATVPDESLPCPQAPCSAPTPAPTARLSILVVEDHLATAKVLEHLLQGDRHRITLASGVHAALDAARQQRFDAVLCDIGLPDGNGHDLMNSLHRDYGLRGIALTGYDADPTQAPPQDVGFVQYLTKPATLQQLRSALAALGAAPAPADS